MSEENTVVMLSIDDVVYECEQAYKRVEKAFENSFGGTLPAEARLKIAIISMFYSTSEIARYCEHEETGDAAKKILLETAEWLPAVILEIRMNLDERGTPMPEGATVH